MRILLTKSKGMKLSHTAQPCAFKCDPNSSDRASFFFFCSLTIDLLFAFEEEVSDDLGTYTEDEEEEEEEETKDSGQSMGKDSDS